MNHLNGEACRIKIIRKRVSSLLPSPENKHLYRAVDDDPGIDELVASIRKNGLHVPLSTTLDNYIVAGHRRHAALQRIGQAWVDCRVLPVRRDSMSTDEYIALLRDHNRQRHKSVAEQVREELVDINPDEAYRHLKELRNKSVSIAFPPGVGSLEIEGKKTRCSISGQKADHVKYAKQVVFHDRRKYWPLSVRGVHYALLNYQFMRNIPRKLPYKNDDESYDATSDLLTRLRLNGSIPWAALDDGTRPLKEFSPFDNVREFIRQEVGNLFAGYWRNLLQTQLNHVEVLVEKNTVYSMALSVTERYQIPTSSGRGFNSIDPWHDLHQRYVASNKQRLIVIVLADFDPEGEMIPHVGGRTLRDDFGVEEFNFNIIKAGVTREQIAKYSLPPQNFAKETSSNYEWFVKRNGGDNTVYELEALHPDDMLRDLENAIRSVIDINMFNRETANEQEEAAYLEAARNRAAEALRGLGNE